MADPRLLDRRAKRRIAGELGIDVSVVNRFLRSYDEARETHRWLHFRRANGLPVPAGLDEYMRMLSTDRTGVNAKRMARSGGRRRTVRTPRQ